MEHLRYSCDTLADQAVNKLNMYRAPAVKELQSVGPACCAKDGDGLSASSQRNHLDYYDLLQQHASSDEVLLRLWTEIHTVPEWVDWKRIEAGQDVFYRYVYTPAT